MAVSRVGRDDTEENGLEAAVVVKILVKNFYSPLGDGSHQAKEDFASVCARLHPDALVTFDRDLAGALGDADWWIEWCIPFGEEWWGSHVNLCWGHGHARFFADPFPHWIIVRDGNTATHGGADVTPEWRARKECRK